MLRARVRSTAIQGLIAGTLAFGYLPDADAALAECSDPFVQELVDEVERGVLLPDRPSVLRRLALGANPAIRARVAEAAGTLAGEDLGAGLSLVRLLAHDPEAPVRAAAARGLAQLLEQAPGAVRAAIESQWATARAAEERVVLAHALARSTPDWLTDLAIAELASDPEACVRRAALSAVELQLDNNPRVYVSLAAAHLADADRGVRKRARHILRRAEPAGWVSTLKPGPAHVRESKRRFRRAMRGDPGRVTRAQLSHAEQAA
jgi:HEAT repeat protein